MSSGVEELPRADFSLLRNCKKGGWELGGASLTGKTQVSLGRCDCGGLICWFSLSRMAGEYPNSVSICKYLHVLVCPWLSYQEPT
jgi:hypothetical protein